VKIVKKIQPPTGLSRFAFRVPIYLYRLKLGWLFGHRLLLLNHIGRVTGKPRQNVLEVAGHDAADGSYVVASGVGTDRRVVSQHSAEPRRHHPGGDANDTFNSSTARQGRRRENLCAVCVMAPHQREIRSAAGARFLSRRV
jgi:hypothetical protein